MKYIVLCLPFLLLHTTAGNAQETGSLSRAMLLGGPSNPTTRSTSALLVNNTVPTASFGQRAGRPDWAQMAATRGYAAQLTDILIEVQDQEAAYGGHSWARHLNGILRNGVSAFLIEEGILDAPSPGRPGDPRQRMLNMVIGAGLNEIPRINFVKERLPESLRAAIDLQERGGFYFLVKIDVEWLQ